jgi:hypothetical protein
MSIQSKLSPIVLYVDWHCDYVFTCTRLGSRNMRHAFVSPIIGGLVAIIVIGLWMHDGGAQLGSAATPASCHLAMGSSGSVSPMLVGAMIRRGIHC